MKKLTKFTIIGLFIFLGIVLTACGGDPQTTDEPTTGDADSSSTSNGDSENGDVEPPELPEPSATVSADIRLDPATVSMDDADSLMVSGFIYEGLVGAASNGQVIPALAESWSISEDQLDYIFVLRPGAAFHDGSPVTADTVMANFNRWFDPEHPLHGSATYAAWQHIPGIRALSDLNVQEPCGRPLFRYHRKTTLEYRLR